MDGYKLIFLIALFGSFCVSTKSNPLSKSENPCEAEGINPNGGLVPHESKCNNFYLCTYGRPVLMECPENLEFNPKTLECDWPESAGCISSFVKQENVPCEPISEPNCPPHQVNKPAVYLPFPKDCSKFYECNWEVPWEHRCPEGLHFSNSTKVCDYPYRAKCSCGPYP